MSNPLAIPGYSSIQDCGSGGFSTVYSAIHDRTGDKVAIKIFSMEEGVNDPESIENEIDIHRSLFHPFIVHYYGRIRHGAAPAIVLEFADGPTLLSYLNHYGVLDETEAHQFFSQLLSAVSYMHSLGYVHRDLKLENVLLTRKGIVKLADYGFAYRNIGPERAQCVSFPYAAPEILHGGEYTESIDVWSLGVILYALVCGDLPFGCDSVTQVANRVMTIEPEYPDHISPALRDLLGLMFARDPSARINLSGIQNHRWFQISRYSILANDHAIARTGISDYSSFEKRPRPNPVQVSGHMSTGSIVLEDPNITTMCRIVRWKNLQVGFLKVFRPILRPRVESETCVSPFAVPQQAGEEPKGQGRRNSVDIHPVVRDRQAIVALVQARRLLMRSPGRGVKFGLLKRKRFVMPVIPQGTRISSRLGSGSDS
jgi:serine/threonine protein kinase